MSMENNNFLQLLGNKSAANKASKAAPDDRPKAQVWGNIGYYVTIPVEGSDTETERRFVSLAQGIAIDNLEPLATNGKKSWANFQAARNGLKDKLTTVGMDLTPGTSISFPHDVEDKVLCIELRRVGEANTADDEANNPFTF